MNGDTPGPALAYFSISALVFTLLIATYRLWFHPLHHVPGPRLARITELWRTLRDFRGTWHDDILALHRNYGSVVRVSPNEVSVVHSDLARTIHSYQGGTSKTGWYGTWKGLAGLSNMANGMFNTTDPKEHAFLRKRASPIYTMSYIAGMDDKIQPVMEKLLDRSEAMVQEGTIDFSRWTTFFAYDVVSKLCLGETMGFVRDGKDSENFIYGVQDAFYRTSNTGYLPGQSYTTMNPVVVRLGQLFGLRGPAFGVAFGKISVQKVVKRIQSDQRGEKKESDMLDHFHAMKDINGDPASMQEIMVEIGNLLAAGADTTSIAIKAVLGRLIRDKTQYQRLQDELDNAASESGQQTLPYFTVKDLPFLSACIKEGIRIHPSMVYQIPWKAPAEGISLDGYFIPPSATLSMSPRAQNRCQAIFGPDADFWRPECWIPGEGSSEDEIKYMDRNLASFGYGSRTCIGRNLAMFEVYKFISQLLTRFDVQLVNSKCECKIRSFWFAEIEGMSVKLRERKKPVRARM